MDDLALAVEQDQGLVQAEAAQIDVRRPGIAVLAAERVRAVLRTCIDDQVVDDVGRRRRAEVFQVVAIDDRDRQCAGRRGAPDVGAGNGDFLENLVLLRARGAADTDAGQGREDEQLRRFAAVLF